MARTRHIPNIRVRRITCNGVDITPGHVPADCYLKILVDHLRTNYAQEIARGGFENEMP